MDKVQWSFPQYRKYNGIDTWYEIMDDSNFNEIVKMGERFILHEIKAEIYPEKLRIQDMLACRDGHWAEIDRNDYELIKSKI
jgi:hypothetical protein